MVEKTAFDILFEKLSDRGMNPERQISERSFIVPGVDRMSNTKYIIARNKTFYFCAHDSYGTSAYSSNTYTGIYSTINLPAETVCHIYKKDWTDQILRTRKHKTELRYIDENLTITSATNWTPSQILSPTDVNLFLEIHKSIVPLKIVIEHDYLSLIEELKGKTIIGLETDTWLYEDRDLDTFIGLGGQLIENITNASA
ncbi:MAG: hypothetical protein IPH88_08725 [Bacteroidales bacterium]|nr:hypothetical protein [Bacteroidales bacterium]